jgi:hypothetical protein
MDQKTGIGSLYDEFSRGYGAEIRLFCRDFRLTSTYKPTSTLCGRHRPISPVLAKMRLISAGRSAELFRQATESPNDIEREAAALNDRITDDLHRGRSLAPRPRLAGLAARPSAVSVVLRDGPLATLAAGHSQLYHLPRPRELGGPRKGVRPGICGANAGLLGRSRAGSDLVHLLPREMTTIGQEAGMAALP